MQPHQHKMATSSYPYSNPYAPRIAPPFPGAPPIPQNIRVDPQQWSRGRWQYNPAYNPAAQPAQAPAVPWMAGNQWNQGRPPQAQQQQQASYNPYKRQPRAPTAEYLSYKLSDNPLGLTDMTSREELYGSESAQTPWVWAPAELDDEDDEDEESEGTSSQGHGSKSSPSRSNSSSQSWHGYEGNNFPASIRTKTFPTRQSSDPPGTPGHHGTPSRSSSTQPQQQPQTPERNVALQPTFSSKIVVTPNYYRTHSRSSSAMGHSGGQDSLTEQMERVKISSAAPTPLGRHSSMPAVLDSRTSPPNITNTSITHEPDSILSPLVMSEKPIPSSGGRPLGRHATAPSGALDAIPESASLPPMHSASQAAATTKRRKSTKSSKSSRHTSPTYSYEEIDREPTPRQGNPLPPPPQESRIAMPYSLPPAQSASSSTRARGPGSSSTTYEYRAPSVAERRAQSSAEQRPADYRPADYRPSADYRSASSMEYRSASSAAATAASSKNPLPAPPEESRFVPSAVSPGSGRRHPRRKGYWNRRGDHLTHEGYLVYAPLGKQYPRELRDYPDGEEGYKDENGSIAKFSPTRPELPDSLPRLGRPPARPYESFVVYVD
ncbi:hypothetical protein GGG16DRAFT_128514 [Schizophyllum commune]